jgi:triosephosphate isomerase
MRRPLIVGNWKMFNTAAEAVTLINALKPLVADVAAERDVVVCPPFTALAAVQQALKGSAIALGAQNMHWENEGAFTGEVAPDMLLTSGCTYVILGHSERRQYFGETDQVVNAKLHAAFEHGLKPIVCVGERLEERQADQIKEVVLGQLEGAFKDIEIADPTGLALAYEPVWAIGTGHTATPAQAEEVHGLIRVFLRQRFGQQTAEALRIQYGGSVKPDNAVELFSQENIDGGLIGGASLQAESFATIVKAG